MVSKLLLKCESLFILEIIVIDVFFVVDSALAYNFNVYT